MPRAAKTAVPATTDTPAVSLPNGLKLNDRAEKLVADVNRKWQLDEVAQTMLQLAAESITRADEAAAVVCREGLCVPDRWGKPTKHPASLLERDHRAQASQALQRLGLSLGSAD